MRLLDIMTPAPVTIGPDAQVGEALRLMRENHIRHLPVVDGGKLVGLVSDRDLREYTPPLEGVEEFEYMVELLDRKLGRLAHGEVVAFGADAQLGDAVDAMIDRRIGAVCIVDDEDGVVGIVSYVDVLKAVRDVVPRGIVRRRDDTISTVGSDG